MKIKIPQAGRKQVGIAVKVALAVAAAYAIVSGAIYVWPRVKCAVVNPALQAGENSLRMKGCWVAEDSSVQRGYTTYTFTEWPVAEDSRRIRMTLDTETDGSKLGDYAKPAFPAGARCVAFCTRYRIRHPDRIAGPLGAYFPPNL